LHQRRGDHALRPLRHRTVHLHAHHDVARMHIDAELEHFGLGFHQPIQQFRNVSKVSFHSGGQVRALAPLVRLMASTLLRALAAAAEQAQDLPRADHPSAVPGQNV